MDILDVIGAVMKGSQNSSQAPSTGGGTPFPAASHQKQPGGSPRPAQPQAASPGGDILGSILSSVLGGQGQTNTGGQSYPSPTNTGMGGTPRVPSSGIPIGQSVPTGGGSSGTSGAGGFPWGDIVSTVLGAGLGGVASNTVLAPIINQIAQRFNIPPQIAQMVVAFAIAHLVQAHLQGGAGQTQNGNFRVNEVVNGMGAPGGLSTTFLNQTGMPHELADRTGLDAATSTQALQYAFNALGSHVNG